MSNKTILKPRKELVENGKIVKSRSSVDEKESAVGFKFDEGKPDWSLLMYDKLEEVVRVLDHGVKVHGRDSWRIVLSGFGGPHRFEAALARHFKAYMCGEKFDKDTGLPHLAHLICNALFLMHKR